MLEDSPEELTVKKIFDLLSRYFKDTYQGLLNVLHEEKNYKRLMKIGESQFFDAPNETSVAEKSQKSMSCLPAINYLAVQVDDDIDRIIQEKFQGEFLDNLKEEVLKAVLLLSSGQVTDSDVLQNLTSEIKSKNDDDKSEVWKQIKILNDFSENIRRNKKQQSNVTNRQAGPSYEKAFDIHNSDSILSFDSVSSVHTSDLSSFSDEISLSSDEELGEKRKLSLKQLQEKLGKPGSIKMEDTDDEKQVKNTQNEDSEYDSSVNNNESTLTSEKSQRRRKPNHKYAADDSESPCKRQSVEEVSTSTTTVKNIVPRKRGRPRKHTT